MGKVIYPSLKTESGATISLTNYKKFVKRVAGDLYYPQDVIEAMSSATSINAIIRIMEEVRRVGKYAYGGELL